ncbi:hypothetical protein EDE11_13610 [Methylomonas methanica]|uniref:Uncharacterized protein n=1 Tax=Methylomonas methanica TaxID=421 RepID=A0ABY2CG90_METMH|nr:hypothetical protein EDE11_13610 [Methylomonas methanica]
MKYAYRALLGQLRDYFAKSASAVRNLLQVFSVADSRIAIKCCDVVQRSDSYVRRGMLRSGSRSVYPLRLASGLSEGFFEKLRHCQAGFVDVAVVINGLKAFVGGILLAEF